MISNMVKKFLSLILIFNLAFPLAAFAEEETEEAANIDIINLELGDIAPFAGVLLSPNAAAKIITDKKFEDLECDLRVNYELGLQQTRFKLELDTKDITIESWKERHESMMALKAAENQRLHDLVMKTSKQRAAAPWIFAGGMALGMALALGTFAAAVQVSK